MSAAWYGFVTERAISGTGVAGPEQMQVGVVSLVLLLVAAVVGTAAVVTGTPEES